MMKWKKACVTVYKIDGKQDIAESGLSWIVEILWMNVRIWHLVMITESLFSEFCGRVFAWKGQIC